MVQSDAWVWAIRFPPAANRSLSEIDVLNTLVSVDFTVSHHIPEIALKVSVYFTVWLLHPPKMVANIQ